LASLSFGQISITTANTAYSQDFDSMGSAGTAFPTGWTAIRDSGSGTADEALTPLVTEGSATSGWVYNVGSTDATDRALGTLGSGSTIPSFGASFLNSTGNTTTAISISAVMEQWKSGSSYSSNEIVAFSYSTDATSLSDGTWTTVSALDLNEILTTTSSAAAVDGNLAANQTAISSSITGLNWANGANLWIKWTDANDSGSDGMYAIDNFSFTITATTLSTKQNEISGLSMYPNPVKDGYLYLTSDSSSAKSVVIFDLLGKEVLSATTSNNTVNVAGLTGGTYIVKITEDGKTASKKLLIQ
jgi:hypothetical protein